VKKVRSASKRVTPRRVTLVSQRSLISQRVLPTKARLSQAERRARELAAARAPEPRAKPLASIPVSLSRPGSSQRLAAAASTTVVISIASRFGSHEVTRKPPAPTWAQRRHQSRMLARRLAEDGQRLVAEGAVHGAAPVLDAAGLERRREVVLGEVAKLHPRPPREGIVVPVVGDDPRREVVDGVRHQGQHVGPHAEAQAASGDDAVQAPDVAGEVLAQPHLGDLVRESGLRPRLKDSSRPTWTLPAVQKGATSRMSASATSSILGWSGQTWPARAPSRRARAARSGREARAP
jgi:hypothetical protein